MNDINKFVESTFKTVNSWLKSMRDDNKSNQNEYK